MSISKAGTILFQIHPNIVICLDYRIAIPAFTALPCKLYSCGRTHLTAARKFWSDSANKITRWPGPWSYKYKKFPVNSLALVTDKRPLYQGYFCHITNAIFFINLQPFLDFFAGSVHTHKKNIKIDRKVPFIIQFGPTMSRPKLHKLAIFFKHVHVMTMIY